jgi:hypothetical protein
VVGKSIVLFRLALWGERVLSAQTLDEVLSDPS